MDALALLYNLWIADHVLVLLADVHHGVRLAAPAVATALETVSELRSVDRRRAIRVHHVLMI